MFDVSLQFVVLVCTMEVKHILFDSSFLLNTIIFLLFMGLSFIELVIVCGKLFLDWDFLFMTLDL